MKLSIIIISFNTKDLLYECISSIKKCSFNFDYEIIVVDNNSNDDSVKMLYENFPDVKIIANKTNNLFAIANNQAKIATGEYILLLNSDTIVYDDNISRLVEYFDTLDESAICIGPKILNEDKTIQSQGNVGMSHWDMVVKHFKLDKVLPSGIAEKILPPGTYKFNQNIPHEVSWVLGACMLVRANLYKIVGGLNENIEFYGEEPEFGYRTKKLGYKTIYYPNAEIIHLGGRSTKQNTTKSDEQRFRRYIKLINETVGVKYAIGTSIITLLSYTIKYLLSFKKSIYILIKNEWDCIKYLKSHNNVI